MNQNLPRQQSVSKPNAYSPSSSSTIHCRLPSPVSASAGLSARPDRVTQPLSFQNPNPWLPCPYQAVVVLPILGYLEIPQVIHLSAETMSHCSHCVATACFLVVLRSLTSAGMVTLLSGLPKMSRWQTSFYVSETPIASPDGSSTCSGN